MNLRFGLLAFLFFFLSISSAYPSQKEAEEWYHQGEKAATLEERMEAFEKALGLYLPLLHTQASAALHYNVGNCYYHLGQDGFAIFHYRQALRFQPRNYAVRANLGEALQRAGNPAQGSSFSFSLRSLFSAEELGLAYASSLIITLLLWYFRKRNGAWKGAVLFSSSLACILLWGQYGSPLEGVLVEASLLHKDAGRHYQALREEPLPAGTVVSVLESTKEGKWIKVISSEGYYGYIPRKKLEVLQ